MIDYKYTWPVPPHLKTAALIIPIACLYACAGIEDEPEIDAEITNYGIMEERPVEEDSGTSVNPVPVDLDLEVDIGSGEVPVQGLETYDPRLVVTEQTNHIPIAPGTIFGFSWCSSGHPSGLTPIDILIEAPLITDGIPGRQQFIQVWALGDVVDGTICRTESHLLADDVEITPGVWIFSILMNRRIIVTKEFIVGR